MNEGVNLLAGVEGMNVDLGEENYMLLSRPSMQAWPSIWRLDDTACLRGF